MRRKRHLPACAAIALAGAALLAPTAFAQTVNVHPGAHALRDAIHGAKAGDTLRVHQGHYGEHVTINKKVRIEGAPGEGRPVIDAGCGANDTIHIQRNGVALKGLKVIGADEGFGSFPSEVFFDGTTSGRAQDIVARDTCDAEYGINLFATGHIKVLGSKASGFDDSGVYVGGITDTHGGRLNVLRNDLFHNNRGVIVEDTITDADVRIAQNDLHDNRATGVEGLPADGLFLHNTDGIYVVNNASTHNLAAGYHADPNSDDNVLIGNTASNNDGGAWNDEGTGNCGQDNSFSLLPC
jgi:parallel beta helix pectate lyase-like protein